MRDPSLHIKKSDLKAILKTLFDKWDITVVMSLNDTHYDKLVNDLLILSRAYSIVNRSVSVNNNRIEKKVNKLLSSSRMDADIFANLLFHIRQKLKHRGISLIKVGTKDWDIVKVLASKASEFSSEFGLDKKEGFKIYIELGIAKMKKFSILKFQNMHESIFETYQAIKELEEDDDPVITENIYKYYTNYIARKTGIFNNYKENPIKYVYFKRVKEEAKRLGISGEDYIKAQFWGLDFLGGIPDPIQLIGDKAIERVNKYLYKFNIKSNTSSFKLDLKKIKES